MIKITKDVTLMQCHDSTMKNIFSFLDIPVLQRIIKVNVKCKYFAQGELCRRILDYIPQPDGINLVPPDRIPAVLKGLEKVCAFSPSSYSIVSLSRGLSKYSKLFLVNTEAKKYVLKILYNENLATEAKKINKQEIIITKLMSVQRITPRLEYANYEDGIVIASYIPQHALWYSKLNDEKLTKLVLLIKKMHNSKLLPHNSDLLIPNGKIVELDQRVERLIAKEKNLKYFSFVQLMKQTLLFALSNLFDNNLLIGNSLCHYDLHQDNILYDHANKEFILIDWEFAQRGMPLVDLTMLPIFLKFTPEQELLWINTYYGEISNARIYALYYIVKQYIYCHYATVFLSICKNYDFKFSPKQIEEVDPFGKKTNKDASFEDSNTKFYTTAIMLAKQGLINIKSSFFKNCLQVLEQKQLLDYVSKIQQDSWRVTYSSLSKDCKCGAIGYDNGVISLYSRQKFPFKILHRHISPIEDIIFFGTGNNRCVSHSSIKIIIIWDISHGFLLRRIEYPVFINEILQNDIYCSKRIRQYLWKNINKLVDKIKDSAETLMFVASTPKLKGKYFFHKIKVRDTPVENNQDTLIKKSTHSLFFKANCAQFRISMSHKNIEICKLFTLRP